MPPQLGEARALLEQAGDGRRQRRVLVNLGIVQVFSLVYLPISLSFVYFQVPSAILRILDLSSDYFDTALDPVGWAPHARPQVRGGRPQEALRAFELAHSAGLSAGGDEDEGLVFLNSAVAASVSPHPLRQIILPRHSDFQTYCPPISSALAQAATPDGDGGAAAAEQLQTALRLLRQASCATEGNKNSN